MNVSIKKQLVYFCASQTSGRSSLISAPIDLSFMKAFISLMEGTHMTLILASTKDLASMNIAQQIIQHYKFEEGSESFHQNPIYLKKIKGHEVRLLFIKKNLIYTQFITDFFTPQLLIFVSRHSSASGIPTLSVHTPGNLGKAEFGGVPEKISVSPASAMKDALIEMVNAKEEMKLDYEISYECTHHGPSLDVPTMFTELGSSPREWKDLKAAEAVAHATMAAVSKRSSYPAVLGIGGPHYNKKFTKIALTTEKAFGHMIPKYAISKVNAEMIKHCVERTMENVKTVVLDWKGIKGEDKERLVKTLDEMGLLIQKV
jgi:D-aminoacyl-tRNA deacylase